jgi:hypothetical protein
VSVAVGLGEDFSVDTDSIGPELGLVPVSPVGFGKDLLDGTGSTGPELGLVSNSPVPGCSGLAVDVGYPLFQPFAAPSTSGVGMLSPSPSSSARLALDAGCPPPGFPTSSCLELDLVSEDPSPLLCCPANKVRGKAGDQSSAWVLQLVKVFSQLVGLSCDGYEGKLSALFEDIVASNSEKASGSRSRVGKKGTRELNNLFSSINYDAHSGSTSRGRNKVRDQRGFL